MIPALIGIGVGLLIQLVAFAYGYGKLSQKVESNKTIVSAEILSVGKKLDNHIEYTENNGKEVIRLCERAQNLENRVERIEYHIYQ